MLFSAGTGNGSNVAALLSTPAPCLQVEQAAAEVLECSEAWRKGSSTAKPAGSILKLLAALDELPAAAMLNNAHASEGEPRMQKPNAPQRFWCDDLRTVSEVFGCCQEAPLNCCLPWTCLLQPCSLTVTHWKVSCTAARSTCAVVWLHDEWFAL